MACYLSGGIQMGFSRSQRATKCAAAATTAALAMALVYPAAMAAGAVGADLGDILTAATGAIGSATSPGCAWPVKSTATTANVAAPDPFAAYWLTPFSTSSSESITISGSFPTSRFMSFAVYNDSFQLFTNTVNGKKVSSYLSSYQIAPNQGTGNPWRSGHVRKGQQFTVRLKPTVTAAQQRSENAIPTMDQHAPAGTSGPSGVGYLVFRAYVPAGGDAAVQLPSITVKEAGRSITLQRCSSQSGTTSETVSDQHTTSASTLAVLNGLRDDGVAMSCSTRCTDPELQYFGPSADSEAGLFPDPADGYVEMRFTPKPGYVVVTHGMAPTSPVTAGHGSPGDTIGAHPVAWVRPKFQVLSWSVANYIAALPYPVAEAAQGANVQVGATPDYLTTLQNGYYTVVSSPATDKPSAKSLKANAATWIPTSAVYSTTPEFQLLRNVLPQHSLYSEAFAFLKPPANPSDIISSAQVKKQMGAYYPQAAQCPIATFESGGWTACLAASRA
jgi:hypothetical protein